MNTCPCSTCDGRCCGPVPLTRNRLRAMNDVVMAMSPEERKRLGSQKRDPLTCSFYDTEQNRCSVYEARPQICQVYGLTKGLKCPKTPKDFVLTISPAHADARIEADMIDLEGYVDSTDFVWPT